MIADIVEGLMYDVAFGAWVFGRGTLLLQTQVLEVNIFNVWSQEQLIRFTLFVHKCPDWLISDVGQHVSTHRMLSMLLSLIFFSQCFSRSSVLVNFITNFQIASREILQDFIEVRIFALTVEVLIYLLAVLIRRRRSVGPVSKLEFNWACSSVRP